MFPAWSTARTSKVWEPSASEERLRGELQLPQSAAWVESSPALERCDSRAPGIGA